MMSPLDRRTIIREMPKSMDADTRREFGAVPLVLGMLTVLFAVFVAGATGLWAWLLVGAAIVGAAAIALAVYAGRRDYATAHAAPVLERADEGAHRVLVIADGSCTSQEFRDRLLHRAAGRPTRAYVIAPAEGSGLAKWTGDESGYAAAEQGLEATLAALAAIGVEAEGRVGAFDPIQAADDGLREFPAEELVFATARDGASVVDVARERYDLHITHVVVD
jgi:hypothetical protein